MIHVFAFAIGIRNFALFSLKENHLGKGKIVRGIIVAHDADERLRLALQAIPNVELKLYNVDVTIRSPEKRGSREVVKRVGS